MDQLNFPRPAIPLSPILSKNKSFGQPIRKIHSVLDAKYKCHVTSGRAAIALSLEHAGLQKNDKVLLPAFHCESMVAPVKRIGAKPVFCRIRSDTSLDYEDIVEKVDGDVRALLVTHYFGFSQDLRKIRALCDKNDMVLIEDCAHTFFGQSANQPVGSTGDYAIASSMKIFPVYDGGLLVSNNNDVTNIKLNTPALSFQMKSMLNIIERSVGYKRLGQFGNFLRIILEFKDLAWSKVKKMFSHYVPTEFGPASSDGGYEFDDAWMHTKTSVPSRIIIRLSDQTRIAERRRLSYRKLQDELSDLPGSRPLFDKLPEDTVPLVFPLHVSHPERVFDALKFHGVPIWRFGEFLDSSVSEKVCPISVDYSKRIFQFPCHQALRDQEIDWMIQEIRQTFFAKL